MGSPRPSSEIALSPPPSIGGSIPIVFSYYSEFLAQEKRGEHLSWLCMFWMIGGIYASAMAWAIIPHYGESQKAGGKEGSGRPQAKGDPRGAEPFPAQLQAPGPAARQWDFLLGPRKLVLFYTR